MKKNICFTVPCLNEQSGIVKVVINLVNELINNSIFDITVLSLCDDISNCSLKVDKRIVIDAFPISSSFNKIKRNIILTKRIKHYLNKKKFDLIVISGSEFIFPFFIGSLNNHNKMILWEHRNFMTRPLFRLEWIGRRIAVRYLKEIVCISKKDQGFFSSYKSEHKIKGAFINHIYNLSNYSESRFSYNIESKRILSVGSLSKIKGYDYLINVAVNVLVKFPDWEWDIYGEGSDKKIIANWIKEKNLEGRVNLKGYDPELQSKYPEYSIFVFTSRSEGMGMVLLEAQKFHLPIVSFDINCGPSDVIVDNINGYLIPPYEIELMSKSICNLISNPEKRKNFSLNSMLCHKEFSKDFILKKWIALLTTR